MQYHNVGEVFEVQLNDNPGTGYGLRLHPSEGLEIMGESRQRKCNMPGCGRVVTYFLRGTRRGLMLLEIEYGRLWDPSTITREVREYEIV